MENDGIDSDNAGNMYLVWYIFMSFIFEFYLLVLWEGYKGNYIYLFNQKLSDRYLLLYIVCYKKDLALIIDRVYHLLLNIL